MFLSTLSFLTRDLIFRAPRSARKAEEETENRQEKEKGKDKESVIMTLSNPDVLECPICFLPLTIRVFQCTNGHIACSLWLAKISSICPLCSISIGSIRCRAIEKILESLNISCDNAKYGSKETFVFSNKCDHEKICIYSPFSCPFPHCIIFHGSLMELSQHISLYHRNDMVPFSYNTLFTVCLTDGDELRVLRERDGALFMFSYSKRAVRIQCFEQCPLKGRFECDITICNGSSTRRFQSFTANTMGRVSDHLAEEFIAIPDSTDHNLLAFLDIRILGKDTQHVQKSKGLAILKQTEDPDNICSRFVFFGLLLIPILSVLGGIG